MDLPPYLCLQDDSWPQQWKFGIANMYFSANAASSGSWFLWDLIICNSQWAIKHAYCAKHTKKWQHWCYSYTNTTMQLPICAYVMPFCDYKYLLQIFDKVAINIIPKYHKLHIITKFMVFFQNEESISISVLCDWCNSYLDCCLFLFDMEYTDVMDLN